MLMGAFLLTVEVFRISAADGCNNLHRSIWRLSHEDCFLELDRTAGAVVHMDAALAAPFGSATISDLPGPWLVNSALAAGWLGVLLLVWFLSQLGRQLDVFHSNSAAAKCAKTWLPVVGRYVGYCRRVQ